MRFVRPKSLDRQSGAVPFKTQQKIVQTGAGLTNSMRSRLSELGLIVPQGCKALLDLVDGLADDPGNIPEAGPAGIFILREMIAQCDEKIDVPSARWRRPPWPTRMPGASGRFRASG